MTQTLADRIRLRLTALNKSASAASLEAGLGRSAVQDILSGASGNPRVETLQKLAAILQTTLSYLAEGVDEDVTEHSIQPTSTLSIQVMKRAQSLENGVYLDVTKDRAREIDEDLGVVWRSVFENEKLCLFQVRDDSMARMGIIAGDLITADQYFSDGEITLIQHSLVVVARFIGRGIAETSLRMVRLQESGIELVSYPADGNEDIIAVTHAQMDDSSEHFGPNVYVIDDREFAVIIGRAVRLVRPLDGVRPPE